MSPAEVLAVGGAFDAATGRGFVGHSFYRFRLSRPDDGLVLPDVASHAARQEANKARGASSSSTSLADSVQKHSKVAAEVVRGARDLGGGIFEGVPGIVVVQIHIARMMLLMLRRPRLAA